MKRVGVIGGGQLAWMMAGAAEKLAIELVVQTPSANDPAVAIAADAVLADIDDADATAKLAAASDVITFENEFVDLEQLTRLAQQGVQFYPPLPALKLILDKFVQHQTLTEMGVAVPRFVQLRVNGRTQEVQQLGDQGRYQPLALQDFSTFPMVLKACRHGYDGYGTFIVKDPQALESVLAQSQVEFWLLEEFVPFEQELAVMVARSLTGEVAIYPVVTTQQENQICRRVLVIDDLPSFVTETVRTAAQRIVEQLNYVGVMGIEFFLTRTGEVLVNELAPRTHNSGHYSLDACLTSQFEQQLRAVTGLPLGQPDLTCPGAVMVNLLGYETSTDDYAAKRQVLEQLPQAFVYWYNKTARPGRKLGHVTVLLSPGQTRSDAAAIAQSIEQIWYPSNESA